MAELDTDALSSVDSFFRKNRPCAVQNGDQQEVVCSKQRKLIQRGTSVAAGRGRLGVGCGAINENRGNQQDFRQVTDRILKVGRDKKRQLSEDDLQSEDDNDRDEELVSRTDISNSARARLKVTSVDGSPATVAAPKSKKKKKKGKKEREKERTALEQQQPDAKDQTVAEGLSGEAGNSEKELQSAEDVDDDDHYSKRKDKRKRRKVRSRQKNIVKDKRTVKPDHLKIGSLNYMGRPMTVETKSKLNLPIVASSGWKGNWPEDDNIHKDTGDNAIQDEYDGNSGSTFHDSWNQSGAQLCQPLAVDNPPEKAAAALVKSDETTTTNMKAYDDQRNGQVSNGHKNKKDRKKRRRKKSKYKNLQ